MIHNRPQTPRLFYLTEIDSTNKAIQRIAAVEELLSGSIVMADFQTAGRGQKGFSWESEAGKNLIFSILFHPVNVPANRPFVISEMASLSVKYTLDQYLTDITVKWPNDIYYKDLKITGILIENVIIARKIAQSVIGIGINVNQTEFISDAPNPVSIAQITGQPLDRLKVFADFRRTFATQSERLNNACFDAIHDDYKNAMYRKEGYHKYADATGIFEARIHDIEPTGHLILERPDGSRSQYAFKEVTQVPE